jgi:hypothetical protein
MHKDQTWRRLADGSYTLSRYASFVRDQGNAPSFFASLALSGWGTIHLHEGGFAAAQAPGRWIWFSFTKQPHPPAPPGFVAVDMSASVQCYSIPASSLSILLAEHSVAAMDCDLLQSGFRRIGFAGWSIELLSMDGRPPLVLVPRYHGPIFEQMISGLIEP